MDNYLKLYSLPKMNYEKLENLNKHINNEKIKTIIHPPQEKKYPGTDGFISEFYQTFKDLIPVLLKFFQKI